MIQIVALLLARPNDAARTKDQLHVVVSRFRCGVDDIARAFASSRVFVYDTTGAAGIRPDKRMEPLPESPALYTRVMLPTKGREGFVYLTHIIDHWDGLADHTLFVQDDLGNHLGESALDRLLEVALTARRDRIAFEQVPTSWSGHHPCRVDPQGANATIKPRSSFKRMFVNGSAPAAYQPFLPNNDGVGALWEFARAFGLPEPERYTTRTAAFFVASRACIRRHPVSFYRRLRQYITDGLQVSGHQRNGIMLEHAWKLVLGGCDGQHSSTSTSAVHAKKL